MGDRGNIVILQERYGKGGKQNGFDQLWFYSHWGGSDLPEQLRTALKRKQRWQDDSYLARIIFCAMLHGDLDGETGNGISCRITDNEHTVLVVDVPNQRVYLIPPDKLKDCQVPADFNPEPGQSWTFEDYIKLKELPEI